MVTRDCDSWYFSHHGIQEGFSPHSSQEGKRKEAGTKFMVQKHIPKDPLPELDSTNIASSYELRINLFMRLTPTWFNHLSTVSAAQNQAHNIWIFWGTWYQNTSNIYHYNFTYNTSDASNGIKQYSFYKFYLTLNIGQVIAQSMWELLKTFIFLRGILFLLKMKSLLNRATKYLDEY